MIYRLDKFVENNINPITNNPYDGSWVVYMVVDNEPYKMMCGSRNGCAYTLKINKTNHPNWRMYVGDFISYHKAFNRNAVLVISEQDLKEVEKEYKNHSYNDAFLRDYESAVLIHSTTKENYENIIKCQMLKSWNRLKNEGFFVDEFPIGKQLGDPETLRDFILFGGGTTGEIVVNSKQNNKLIYDENIEYRTGARLYFDMRKIAEDGLLLRDGSGIKVKDSLPLEPYLIWISTWDKIGLNSEISTPKIFAEKSDEFFKRNIKKDFQYFY
ncbi:MAG: hypothetical protein IJX19_02090 [Clostridia bacterium]|nr:hypothetical protein [Clostridia bacterium]